MGCHCCAVAMPEQIRVGQCSVEPLNADTSATSALIRDVLIILEWDKYKCSEYICILGVHSKGFR